MANASSTPAVATATTLPDSPTYGEAEAYDLYWSGSIAECDDETGRTGDHDDDGDPMRFHRRSLDALTGPLFDAGFTLRDLREPDLTDRLDDALVDEDSPLARRPPRSLCLRATLPK